MLNRRNYIVSVLILFIFTLRFSSDVLAQANTLQVSGLKDKVDNIPVGLDCKRSEKKKESHENFCFSASHLNLYNFLINSLRHPYCANDSLNWQQRMQGF